MKSHLPQIIGNTPLLHLRAVSELTGCDIYAKAEFMNPGGSVKDRTALGIIRAAEEAGDLQPGGVVVEGAVQACHHIMTTLTEQWNVSAEAIRL